MNEVIAMIKEMNGAFEGFRTRYDSRLKNVEAGIAAIERAVAIKTGIPGGSFSASGRVFSSFGEQLLVVARAGIPGGQTDPRLFQVQAAATGASEGVPSGGGFLIEKEFSSQILQDAFEVGQLARLCRYQPIGANANGIKIPGLDESARTTGNRHGGVVSYWTGEADEMTGSKPKFRQLSLEPRKITVLVYATDELLEDATALEAFIRKVAPQEIAFRVDEAILRGSGAGQPLGVLNAGSLVTVPKEAEQTAKTILAENVLKMVKRTIGRMRGYAWLYNKECLDQIYGLHLAIGTAGIPLFMSAGSLPNQPEDRLLGIPLIELEQCSALGSLGDLILADFSNGYVLSDKGAIKSDVSIHVRFVHGESVFRFTYRVDGQPIRASALTPYQGTETQSHFVALAARA